MSDRENTEELKNTMEPAQAGEQDIQPVPANYRAGFAAIVGRPNVGKSTLMNHLIGMKLAITSRKPQTTRKRMQTVYTSEEGQIVFLDTPGIHRAKNRLGEYMDRAAVQALRDVDCILWLVEPVPKVGAGEKHILEVLQKVTVPVILVINKTDTIKDREIPAVIEAWRDVYPFHRILPVSAKHGTGKETLLKEIFSLLPYGEPFYDEDTVTDETERSIVAEQIREQALRCLAEEVPHGIAVEIERMKEEGRFCEIDATIYCEKTSHKGIIIGKGGEMLKKIGTGARIEAEKLLDRKVVLKLWVKVRKDWRSDEKQVRSFGYRD